MKTLKKVKEKTWNPKDKNKKRKKQNKSSKEQMIIKGAHTNENEKMKNKSKVKEPTYIFPWKKNPKSLPI
jgi:hypothetical protein